MDPLPTELVATQSLDNQTPWNQYRLIARRQRMVMVALVGGVGLLVGCSFVPELSDPFPWVFWGVKAVQLTAVWALASAMELEFAFAWALGSMLSWPGMIVLLIVSHRATRILRKAGIRVGLLGAKCPPAPPPGWSPPAWERPTPSARL